MKRRELFIALVTMTLLPVLATLAMAQTTAQKLNASEIEDVLAGNTIEGVWGGDRYRQFFAEDGSTIYVPSEGKRVEGRWRVDPDRGIYESWWRSTGWKPYAMVDLPDSGYAWVNGDAVETFEVKDGRQIE
jgi:hypothetical protein